MNRPLLLIIRLLLLIIRPLLPDERAPFDACVYLSNVVCVCVCVCVYLRPALAVQEDHVQLLLTTEKGLQQQVSLKRGVQRHLCWYATH